MENSIEKNNSLTPDKPELDREKLAEIIYNDMREGFFKFLHPINDYPMWDKSDERWRTTAYRQADIILSAYNKGELTKGK